MTLLSQVRDLSCSVAKTATELEEKKERLHGVHAHQHLPLLYLFPTEIVKWVKPTLAVYLNESMH